MNRKTSRPIASRPIASRKVDPRPVDHCVLPVENLDVARSRLSALGFTVAPRADHPFGTANTCVYFTNDSYLEPLAIVDAELARQTALKRNVFAVRDAAYRFRNGPEGFSALVMGTANANADHRKFVFSGISAGRQLVFSRPFEMPDGTVSEASFRLAFAADPRSPDVFFFTCERTKQPQTDRTKLQRHANGVRGISRIVMSERSPADFDYFCQQIVGTKTSETTAHSVDIAAKNAIVSLYDADECKAQFGIAIGDERGLRLQAIVFDVASITALCKHLDEQSVDHEMRAGRALVKPVAGQGAVFAFEEKAS